MTPAQPVVTKTPEPPSPPRTWKDFIWDHFAVLIVFSIFCVMLGVYITEVHLTGNDQILTWLQNEMSDLISAMLMGLTGAGAAAAIKK